MSSSASRAPGPPASRISSPWKSSAKEPSEALPFPYSEVAPLTSPHVVLPAEPAAPGAAESAGVLAAALAEAREMGRRQGEIESHAKFEEQLGRERAAVAKALTDFARERARYYRKIEEEAVQLALSIARKVLHREAQVAVHPQQAAVWRNYLVTRVGPGELPEIVEDPAMALEQCELRTSMGTAELGLEVQLKEIEQGLMDLLAARPQEPERERQKEQEKEKP
jgi:flagellar biosynthesis/type III secretory pathway protein FliH